MATNKKGYVTIAERMLIEDIYKEAQKVLGLAKAKGIKDFYFTCEDGRGKSDVEAINYEIDCRNARIIADTSRNSSSGHAFN
jgi:hypothetical protein